jgi:hypothetical protein
LPAKPPIQTRENNPIHNTTVSTVDRHGLGELVRKLRSAGGTHISIANEINDTILKDNIDKVSSSAVWRWMNKNITDDEDYRTNNDAVNVYLEESQMLKSVTKQVDILEGAIDVINSGIKKNEDVLTVTKQLKELALTYEKLLSNKQRLVNSIGIMQEKIYSYININTIITIIMDMVKEKDFTLYADIKEEIKKDPILNECFKNISKK